MKSLKIGFLLTKPIMRTFNDQSLSIGQVSKLMYDSGSLFMYFLYFLYVLFITFQFLLGILVQCFDTCNTDSGLGAEPDYPGYERRLGDCPGGDIGASGKSHRDIKATKGGL